MSDEWLRSNPSATAYKSPSLTLRQEITDEGVPRLGAAAARKAIEDWGRHASGITHLVVSTTQRRELHRQARDAAVQALRPISFLHPASRFCTFQLG